MYEASLMGAHKDAAEKEQKDFRKMCSYTKAKILGPGQRGPIWLSRTGPRPLALWQSKQASRPSRQAVSTANCGKIFPKRYHF